MITLESIFHNIRESFNRYHGVTLNKEVSRILELSQDSTSLKLGGFTYSTSSCSRQQPDFLLHLFDFLKVYTSAHIFNLSK